MRTLTVIHPRVYEAVVQRLAVTCNSMYAIKCSVYTACLYCLPTNLNSQVAHNLNILTRTLKMHNRMLFPKLDYYFLPTIRFFPVWNQLQ